MDPSTTLRAGYFPHKDRFHPFIGFEVSGTCPEYSERNPTPSDYAEEDEGEEVSKD